MKAYADTNYFVRLYLDLPESELADALAEAARRGKAPPLPVTWLLRLEFTNALQRLVFETRTGGQHRVSHEAASAALATFDEHLDASGTIRGAVIAFDSLIDQARQIILRQTPRYGFRIYDVLHVTSALVLGCDTFWSFDERAKKLAKLEGLKTN